MPASLLPDGTVVRPPTLDDAPAVVALMNAIHEAVGETPSMNVEELRRDWHDVDLATDAVLLLDPENRLVAFADLLNARQYVQVSVYGFVCPDLDESMQAQLWRYLILWGETWTRQRMDRAPAGARVAVQHFLLSSLTAARAVLESLNYANVRTHYVMRADLADPVPAPHTPPGLQIRTYRPGRDDDAIFTAGEESFQDIWNRPPSTRERWLAPARAEGFDPTLWFWAEDVDRGEPAAMCLCSLVGDRGEVDQVGVRRAWRGRGVGLALLRHALGDFRRRGISQVTLNVDAESPTGAPRLYGRAGFVVQQSYSRYEKELRSGTWTGSQGP